MSKGVVILAITDPQQPKSKSYLKWAENLRTSIRYHNDLSVVILNKVESCYSDGRFSPSFVKMNISKYLPFDRTIYLDADSLVIKDLNPLFDMCTGYFHTSVFDTIKGESHSEQFYWMETDQMRKQFDLDNDIPVTNTSFMYLEKGAQLDKLFNEVNTMYDKRPDRKALKWKWANVQPDELYFNAALSKLNYDPALPHEPVCFRTNTSYNPDNDYFVMSMYGGRTFTHSTMKRWYNKYMKTYNIEVKGHTYFDKAEVLSRHKFVDYAR